MPHPNQGGPVLNRHAAPDMGRNNRVSVAAPKIVPHERTALGENLVDMPICLLHDTEDLVYELPWDLLVKKIAHGIHEDPARSTPPQRLAQTAITELKVKPSFVRMTDNTPESFGKALSIAIVATARDLGATRNRVPSRVSPFDCRVLGHCSAMMRQRYAPRSGLTKSNVQGIRRCPHRETIQQDGGR